MAQNKMTVLLILITVAQVFVVEKNKIVKKNITGLDLQFL